MDTLPNASELKDREHRSWTGVAPGWRKHDDRLVASGAPVTARMIALLHLRPGMHVLDIACGTGEPAIPIAQRVGSSGTVVAIDFVDEMLAFAREKAASRGVSNIKFSRVDGEQFDAGDDPFDAATIRWGLMFMPEPVECLRRVHGTLKDGGRLALACWATPDKNPWAAIPMASIRTHLNAPPPPPGSPGLFAFGDRARLQAVIEDAGFRDVIVEPVELSMADFDSGEEFFTFVRELAGPVATLFAQLSPDAQAAAQQEIISAVTGPDGGVRLPGVTWVASGRK